MGLLDWLPWGGEGGIEEETVPLEEVPRVLIATAIDDMLDEPNSAASLLDELEEVESYQPGTRALEHLAVILTAQLLAMKQDDRLQPHADEFLHQAMALFVEESLEEEFRTVERVRQFHDIQSRRIPQHMSLFQSFMEEEGNIGRATTPLEGLSFKGRSMLIAYMGDQYRMYRENFNAWTIEGTGE